VRVRTVKRFVVALVLFVPAVPAAAIDLKVTDSRGTEVEVEVLRQATARN
jgi:hypothetical protein